MGKNSKARRDARKKKQRKGGSAQSIDPITPRRSQASPNSNLGYTPPPESTLLGWAMTSWQDYMRGESASHCAFAVLGIQEVLNRFGIRSEPLVVSAFVQWSSGQSIEIGTVDPRWEHGKWNGHVVLWVPTLERFMDPTIFQANRPGTPTRITSGLQGWLPDGPASLPTMVVPKDGTFIRYFPQSTPPDWLSGATEKYFAEVHRGATIVEKHILEQLHEAQHKNLVTSMTHEPLVANLRARGLR